MAGVDAASDKLRVGARSLAATTSDTRAWRDAALILVVTRAVFLAVAYAASWYLASGRSGVSGGLLDVWSRWDAVHFYSVADHGYTGPQSDPHATAFFPAFPLALRALAGLGMSHVVGGLVISALCSLVAFAYLHKLAEHEIGPGAGRCAALYLALFPTAVFLVAPYSEALFLAGAIPAFYLARRRRWTAAGVPAAVAVGARAAGLFVLAGLAAELVRQRDFSLPRLRAALVGLFIGGAPLLAYGAYLAATKGSALYFLTDQRLGWGRTLTNPVTSFANTWNTWEGAGYPSNWIFAWRIEIVAALAGVAFTAWAFAQREWGYGVFMATLMAALLTSTWYFSIPRMLLSMFPIAALLAGATRRHRELHELLLVVLAPLATLGVVVFTRGAWFY